MTKLSMSQVFSFLLLLNTCAGFEGESKCENACASRGVSFVRRCQCDSTCAVVYNDCCYDSPYKLTTPPDNIPEWQCSFVPGERKYFFMIGKCQDGWDGDRGVIRKCERNSSHLRDPYGQVPVTSRTTEKTYKNYYCSVCNDDMDDRIWWQIKAHCDDDDDITLEDVQNNLQFNSTIQQWGVYKKESLSGRSTFHECQIIYDRPIDVSKESVRECVPGLISSCPPSWRDLTIKRKCESYVNPVFLSHQESYRNIYCAVCNYQNKDDYWCRLDTDLRPNYLGGPHLGRLLKTDSTLCNENKLYDPVKNICRQTVYCRKGQVVRNDKCVKSN